MKKNFLLTLLLVFSSALQCWAEFNPTVGKMYALKEVTSGLYLDIQTLGIVDGQRNTDNISLNAAPRIIYFENGSIDGTWHLKNINGKYVKHSNDGHWNPEIEDDASDWNIAETNGKLTIARTDGKFLNVDTKEAGRPLYCDKATGMEFTLVELYAALKSPTGTYLHFTPVANGNDNTTQASFQEAPSYLYINFTSDGITFEDKANLGRYIGVNSNKNWNVDFGLAYWIISTPDSDGFVTISQKSKDNQNLGHDKNTNDGTGIFTNVGASVNKWMIELYEDVSDKYENTIPTFDGKDLETIKSYGQYLTALILDGNTVFTGRSQPMSQGDMYVLAEDRGLNVQPGGTHTFNLTFPKNQTSQILAAVLWIDKDGDGTYETNLGTTGSSGSNSNNLSIITFTVPADATLGKTRIRLRLDSSWGITNEPNAPTNRMIYDIPVTVDNTPKAAITYNFYHEGVKIGSENSMAVIGSVFPAPQTQFKVANELLKFELPEGVVAEAGGTFDVSVNFKKDGFPQALTINNGQFAIDTQWYLTTLRGKYLKNIGSALRSQTEKEYSDATYFAIAGDPLNGYKLYNKALGVNKVIYSNSPNNLNSEVTLIDNPTGTWYVADNSKGGFSFYIPYNGNNFYFHEKDGPIKYWSSEDAKGDAGSNFVFEPVYDFTLDISNAPTAVEVTYNGNSINMGDKISRIGFDETLINSTDIPDFYWTIVVDNANAKVYVVYKKYYTFDFSNLPANVTVSHNGQELTDGAKIKIEDFYAGNVDATNVDGYVWQVAVDQEENTITLIYKEQMQPVIDLVNRIGGAGTDANFKFILDPSLHQTQETFVLGTEDGKILIKGTTISAITTGLGWYLNNIAKVNIAWNSLNEKTVDFGKTGAAYVDNINLPRPTTTETHSSDAKYRYYLNTCTFGYSMTSWTWTRWQQEIDWMALHGINMPLQLVGMEEVWRKFLTMEDAEGNRKYGYTDEAAKAFVAGPAFIAWWAMNNLEGWGGTDPGTKSGGTWEGAGGVQDDAWYVRQKNLSNSIVTRQRELGMQPVLPGWSGMVPTNFAAKSGYATRGNGGNWAGDFVRPLLLNVSNANYAEIAADYYACLKDVMGESQYYSMDPFHEGGGAGTAEDYQALYAAMETAKPNSQWVIQQWQWSATQKLSLTNVPDGKLIVLDLFSDGSPAFDGYNGYTPQEAVFCAIPNFGGRSGLMGRLQNVTENYFKFKNKYASIKGVGTAPEAIEQTPITYDLIYQLPWMNGTKPNVEEWVKNYAVARYGQDNEVIKEAWNLLRQGPLNYGADGIQGPVEDVWAARPNLNANPASYWGKTLNNASGTYTKERRQMLIDATYKLLGQEDVLNLTTGSVFESNYHYDLVEFGGAVMADYAYDLLKAINTAKNSEGINGETYKERRDAFLALIADVDKFKGTNLNFRLGKWTQEARDAAQEAVTYGATTATSDWYEYNNARTIVSTWSHPNTNLNDYSYRSWQGLMKDLYLPRWQYYFNNNCNGGEYGYFEWNWAHGMTHSVGQTTVSKTPLTAEQAGHTSKYSRQPEGNTITEAWNLLNKYIVPLKATNGTTKYAYRHLGLEHNDYSSSITIEVRTGIVDLTPYLGNLANVTLASNALASNATDLSVVNVTGAAGTYDAILTLTDKTVIKLKLKVGSAFDKVTNLANISNTCIYSISTDRGPIAYIPTHSENELSTPKKSTNENVAANATQNTNEQFAILRTTNTPADKYYLYNLSKKAFVNINGDRASFSATPVAAVSFTATGNSNFPWFVWVGGEKRMNINAGDGLILRTETYASADEGNRFYLEPIADDAETTAVALEAVIAQEFLNSTPQTVGYPKTEKRNTFQSAIDARESVNALTSAKTTFTTATDVNMPEDGKAYVIRNVHPNGNTYMLTSSYSGNTPQLPTATANPEEDNANIFICREANDGYVFINASHGKYMLFHGQIKNVPLSADGFSESYSVNNILKLHSQASKRFGTLSIAGKRDSGTTYGTMTISSDGYMDANGGENNAAYSNSWSSLFTFEQIDSVKYSVNAPKQTPISSEDVLLKGVSENQTISTFSAPYATVMPAGVTAYYAKKANVGEVLYLTAIEKGKALPANEGVILVGEVGTKSATILPATTEEVAEIDNIFANSATGPVEMGENDYILANGTDGIGIYKAQKGLLLAAGKAFLRFDVGGSAPKLVLSIEKEPTSVQETLIDNPTKQVIYDLGGRRVYEISKGGFYVVNGKKMFVK